MANLWTCASTHLIEGTNGLNGTLAAKTVLYVSLLKRRKVSSTRRFIIGTVP